MVDTFPGLPGERVFETTFNYKTWLPGTRLQLCNVPWDASYRDIVRFDDEGKRRDYFAALADRSQTVLIDNVTVLKIGEPIFLNISFDQCMNCNYIVVDNTRHPNDIENPTRLYYFVTDVEYISPNTTKLNIQLDVWQTYYDRLTFEQCYVYRSHAGIAAENVGMADRNVYALEPEGLDVGSDYDVVSQEIHSFIDDEPLVIVTTTASFEGDLGSIDNPNLTTAKPGVVGGVPTAAEIYGFSAKNFEKLMRELSDKPWISQCIINISVVPRCMTPKAEEKTVMGVSCYDFNRYHPSRKSFRTENDVIDSFDIPKRYAWIHKFYTYPYTVLELTNFAGQALALKSEFMYISKNADSGRNEVYFDLVTTCAPPYIRGALVYRYNITSRLEWYNHSTENDEFTYDYYDIDGKKRTEFMPAGDNYDIALFYDNFPQLTLVNNSYMQYLASTAHSRAYAAESADWSNQKALTGAQLTYNQTSRGLEAGAANLNVSNDAAWAGNAIAQERNTWGAVQSVGSGVAGIAGGAATMNAGAAAGSAVGAVTSGVNAALNADWMNRQTMIGTGAATKTFANSAGATMYNRDTNYDYARFAAKGDYANAIAGIQAKVQDAKVMQPSVIGQQGGELFNFNHGLCGFGVKWKRIKMHYLIQIGEYWLRYGTVVNRWIKPPENLQVMTKCSYWHMQSCTIRATMPEAFKQAVRGIFEKGVTVWRNPDEINAIDFGDNKPSGGFELPMI